MVNSSSNPTTVLTSNLHILLDTEVATCNGVVEDGSDMESEWTMFIIYIDIVIIYFSQPAPPSFDSV